MKDVDRLIKLYQERRRAAARVRTLQERLDSAVSKYYDFSVRCFFAMPYIKMKEFELNQAVAELDGIVEKIEKLKPVLSHEKTTFYVKLMGIFKPEVKDEIEQAVKGDPCDK